MKSNICTITDATRFHEDVLNEVEKCAAYNNATKAEALRLRLLAEELLGIIPNLSKGYTGSFWIETAGSKWELHLALDNRDYTEGTDKKFLDISSTGANAAEKGIGGRIRTAIANMIYHPSDIYTSADLRQVGYTGDMGGTMYWSLAGYCEYLPKADTSSWDELEKSVLAKAADDVIVGVAGRSINITVVKTF